MKKTSGKIYKIHSPNHNKCYIGSTRQSIESRMSGHRKKANTCASLEIINSGGALIELIEDVEEISNIDLRKLEQKYIEEYDCVNSRNAYYDKLEYDRLFQRQRKRNMRGSPWRTL